ncbi:MAG: antibiotic biosynthesis monooxygenase [Thermoanaerobaculia bacterium]
MAREEEQQMFMRFLHLQVQEGKLPEYRRFFVEQVVPALDATEGCEFAALLQQTVHPDEFVALTLWRDSEHLEAYEASPVFRRLLERGMPYLAGSTGWQVRTLEPGTRVPEGRSPAVAYRVEASAIMDDTILPTIHVRLVSVQMRPGAAAEFKKRFVRLVIPELEHVKGCRGVFLVEDPRDPARFVSVSIWDREESAIRYELSGAADDLTAQLKDTFADLQGWHLAHAEGSSSSLAVRGYNLVMAKRL